GKYNEAEPLHERSLPMRQKALDPEHRCGPAARPPWGSMRKPSHCVSGHRPYARRCWVQNAL
ncbi:unnamed protein product, partial [Ectocarpus sp. 12 AP-2014]